MAHDLKRLTTYLYKIQHYSDMRMEGRVSYETIERWLKGAREYPEETILFRKAIGVSFKARHKIINRV